MAPRGRWPLVEGTEIHDSDIKSKTDTLHIYCNPSTAFKHYDILMSTYTLNDNITCLQYYIKRNVRTIKSSKYVTDESIETMFIPSRPPEVSACISTRKWVVRFETECFCFCFCQLLHPSMCEAYCRCQYTLRGILVKRSTVYKR